MAAAKPTSQALLKRNPAMSQQEFSDHWFYQHGAIVAPYFLSFGYRYYAQIHGPLSTQDTALEPEIAQWHGAAESVRAANPPTSEPPWKEAYYNEVIRVDERRFLVSEAMHHYKRTEAETVLGEKKVVISEGKAVIDIPDEVMRVWREYEARGKKEEEETQGQ